jgi:GNAT superfamily N-acetyltransferase
MSLLNVYEVIGYVASILVAISLMMTSILKLRVINLIGSACFTAYGLLIGAYPVAVVNLLIVLINLYFLYDAYHTREYFKLLDVSPQSEYLQYFLKFYDEEIKRFLPDFSYRPAEGRLVFFILRDMVPAGLFIARPVDKDTILIDLDFVIPGYRDFKIGRFVFEEKAEVFKARGIRKVYSRPGTKKHEEYLRSMGFVPDQVKDGETLYSLTPA